MAIRTGERKLLMTAGRIHAARALAMRSGIDCATGIRFRPPRSRVPRRKRPDVAPHPVRPNFFSSSFQFISINVGRPCGHVYGMAHRRKSSTN